MTLNGKSAPRALLASLMVISLYSTRYTMCYELQDLINLKAQLFNQSNYDTTVRPIMNQSQVLKVTVALSFSAITNFTVTTGTLKMLSLISFSWIDEQLQWNASEYGGVARINIDSDMIWTPVLTQMKDVGYKFPVSPSWVFSTGQVILVQAGELTGSCKIDMLYFPYDLHECYFDLVSLIHNNNELSLHTITDKVNLEQYLASGQWDLLDTVSKVTVIFDHDTDIGAYYYANRIKIRRKPQFLIVHVVVPLGLILTLNTFVYIVPLDSGERISISVTLLLTMVFFTTDLSDTIPESSDNISLTSMLMVAINCSSALSVAASVILCRIVTSSKGRIPAALLWLAKLSLRKVKVSPQKSTNKVEAISIVPDNANEYGDEERTNNFESSVEESEMNSKEKEITWKDVAKRIECLLFSATLVFVVVIGLGFIGVMIWVYTKSFRYDA